MYSEHFGLVADPFSLTPDPAFLYLSPDHREALAAVQYGLLDGRGFVTLIGEVGTGKTTLVYSILGRRHPGLQTAYVSYSAQRFEDLLASALKDLNVQPAGTSKVALLESLNSHLLRRADDNQATALILDEAQNLSDETFEELRLLSNFETYTRKLLQIVLVGQPELQERLRQPGLRQLRERVSVRAYVNPLPRDQMAKYITHRLERAGGDPEKLFTPRALRILVRRSRGIPRRANILCHNALLFAFGRNLDRVTHIEAQEAVAEMDERRPGRLRRPALRRVRLQPSTWGWAAVLSGALVVGVMAGQHWSPSAVPQGATPSLAAVGAAPDVALMPGGAIAAVQAPEPVVAPATSTSDAAPAPPVLAQPEGAPLPRDGHSDADPPPTRAAAVSIAEPEPATARDSEASDSMSIVVPQGAALWTLLRNIYGDRFTRSERARIFLRVRELNPQMTDVNVIIAGERLRLPVPPRTEQMAGGGE